MRSSLKNNVRLLFAIFLVSVIAFNFIQIKVYAAPLTELNGEHAFGDTYFNFNGSNTAESDDGKFLLSASKYNLNSDDHSAWIDDADTVTEETAYLEVKNHGTLGSFNLESVDLGEYQDGTFKDVHVEGYANGKKVFSTMAYSNLKDGAAVKNFPLNLDAAKGKNIDSFRICYTKGAGIDIGHYDFNIYSFTISNASTDLPADKTPPAAVANITVSDNDTTSGVDGRDFTIGFTDSADDASDVSGYRIYIYKDGEEPADKAAMDALPAGSKAAVKTITRTAGNDGSAANLGSGVTTDSKGQALAAGDYWVIVTAQDLAGNYSFAKSSVKAAITDDMPPLVTLSISGNTISENGGVATITAALSSKSYQPVIVDLSLTGSAINLTDYTLSSNSIVIPAGSLTGTITLTAKDNAVYEGDKTVIVEISKVTGGVESGTERVNAVILEDELAALSKLNGIHTFNNTNFTCNSSISMLSKDGNFLLIASRYKLNADATSVWIEENDNAMEETVYIELSNFGDLGSFTLESVDLGEFGDGIFNNVHVVGYANGKEVFSTTPYSNSKDGSALSNFPLDLSATSGKVIESFRIYYTKGKGTGFSHSDFSIYSFTISCASKEPAPNIIPPDTIAPEAVTNVTLTDNDTTPGIDGRDFTVGFDNSVDDAADLSGYSIYMYKDGEEPADKAAMDALPAGSKAAIKTIERTAGDDGADANLGIGITTDSKGQLLVSGDYWVIVTVQDTAGNYSFTKSSAKTAITDDLPPSVTLSIAGSPMSENGGVATITATLSSKSYQPVTVDLSLTGSAINLTDYIFSSNSIVIPVGSLTGIITLTAKDNAVYEGNKTVIVRISGVTNGKENGTQQVTATLADDDPAPMVTLSKSAGTITENGGSVTLTATLSVQSIDDITVNLGYTGTATEGSDYTAPSVAITIPAGSLSGTVTITGLDDTGYEGDETVIADITSVTGGIENGTQQQTVTITDDDSAPIVTLSTNKASISENCGTAEITATLSNKSYQDVTIDLSLTGSAICITDYAASANSIVIPAGSISGLIKLEAKDNDVYEGDKTVVVDIAGITNGAEKGKQQVNVSITDNETTPSVTLSVAGSPFLENGGTATITAILSNKSYQPVTVDLSLTGSAINLTDYTASANSIFIPAGILTGSAILTAKDNAVYEGDKTVIVDISGVANGTVGDMQEVTATISEDEVVPPSSQYLSNLIISSGTLASAFNKNIYSYTASVGYDASSIVITPTAEVPTAYGQNATIKVNGVTVASGMGSPVDLNVGVNTIYIDVTSAVGNVTQRYTLTVTRSSDAYLSNITISGVTLSQPFSKTVYSYTGSTAGNTTKITPTAEDTNAAVTINGTSVPAGRNLKVSLQSGINNIEIIITSATGSDSKKYVFQITRNI